MTGVSVSQRSVPAAEEAPATRVTRLPRWFEDRHGWIAAAIYLIVVIGYEHYPIQHLGSVCSCQNSDPTQWMWSWKWLTYAIGHGLNPLSTNLIWPGKPFDLASITLAPTTALAGIPLQALFGSIAAYNLIAFSSPIICGWAAYRLCRYVSGAPWPSILAGYTYGFSAYEVGHLLGHLNLLLIFVPPMLVLLVLRYIDGEVSRRRVLISGFILLLLQFGLSTEMLFDMSYLGAFCFIVGFCVSPPHRRRLIEVVILLAIAYALMALLCSYYIYESVHGPQESGGAATGFPSDLNSYLVPTQTFKLGSGTFQSLSSGFVTGNPYEQNSYLGLPLIGIMLAFGFTSWRQRATKVIVLGSIVAFVLSLGVFLTISGLQFFELPYGWLLHFPFFNEAIPSRLGLFVALGAALGAALWISWARGRANTVWRWLVGLVAVGFLLPNPGLYGRIDTPAQPKFFTTSIYKNYVRPHEIVMTIPFSQSGDDMLWQADTDMYFRLAGGYLGYPPPQYSAIPIVHFQLYTGAPIPPAHGVSEIRSLVSTHHIGVVLVQVAQAQNWPSLLIAAQFRLEATVGGMQVYALPKGLS
jgi:hypothetical protein